MLELERHLSHGLPRHCQLTVLRQGSRTEITVRDCLADSVVRRALNDRHLSNDDLLMTLIDDVVREVDKKRH